MTPTPVGPSRPSLVGEALKLAMRALPVFAAALALTVVFPGRFRFTGRLWGVAAAAGMELAAAGLVLWCAAALGLVRALSRGGLATRGAYGLCRHPLHGGWTWSVLPSLALMLDSWLFLAAALASWIAARPLLEREEQELAERFGTPYCAWEVKRRPTLPVPLLRPFTLRRWRKALGGLALLAVFALGVFFAAVRPVILRLGASRAELAAALPGDEAVSRPRFRYTQAVMIRAPAHEVWKWLVQVGYRRAGWYNIDAVNRLAAPDYFIDGLRSSVRIHPELQDLRVGDSIFLVPALGMQVTRLEPARLLVLVGDPAHPDSENNSSWTYAISPLGEGSCRLVVRFRSSSPGDFASVLGWGIINEIGGAMLQQPAMLAGLRRRAER
jgi:protein-S-isoprenylcysteine O-methyltransferase Ste14